MSNRDRSRGELRLSITNSITRRVELFEPIDGDSVSLYVCGPTVYDRAHLGNLRSAVVYDMLVRVLRAVYGDVRYVRNITDIDDKIINRSKELSITAGELADSMVEWYRKDVSYLNCVLPSYEPRVTENMAEIIAMIQQIIDNGYAYYVDGNVLFDTVRDAEYGNVLSKQQGDDLVAGARVLVESYKKNGRDFVLWKPSKEGEEGFDSPWGFGRPGWHIECSVMSCKYLGDMFDIHGGGLDLVFPHHENEIAQARAVGAQFARYWIHNGFLTIDGEKMSKSLKNIYTLEDTQKWDISADALRYFYLTAHYHKPLDLNKKAIYDAKNAIRKFQILLRTLLDKCVVEEFRDDEEVRDLSYNLQKILCGDLNFSAALAYMHRLYHECEQGGRYLVKKCREFYASYLFMGFSSLESSSDIAGNESENGGIPEYVMELVHKREKMRKSGMWGEADRLRDEIAQCGYVVRDEAGCCKVMPNDDVEGSNLK